MNVFLIIAIIGYIIFGAATAFPALGDIVRRVSAGVSAASTLVWLIVR